MCDSRCMVHGLQLQEVLCSLHISTAYKLTCLWLQLAKESRGAHLLENLWPESLKFSCFIAGLRWQEGLVCFLRPVAHQDHTREASAPLNLFSFGLRLTVAASQLCLIMPSVPRAQTTEASKAVVTCVICVQALLQQAFRLDAKRQEREQHEARLVRVAALDDAALFRSTHSAKQHQTLKSQLRQSIQLAAC